MREHQCICSEVDLAQSLHSKKKDNFFIENLFYYSKGFPKIGTYVGFGSEEVLSSEFTVNYCPECGRKLVDDE